MPPLSDSLFRRINISRQRHSLLLVVEQQQLNGKANTRMYEVDTDADWLNLLFDNNKLGNS